jgi:hypothetical protein
MYPSFSILYETFTEGCSRPNRHWGREPSMKEMKFEDVVKAAEQAAVLVLVY